jgi:hypothetical protein
MLRSGRIVSLRLRLAIRNSHPARAARKHPVTPLFYRKARLLNESVSEQSLAAQVAAYVGIDWADQKHDVVLRSVGDPAKAEHQVLKSEINALSDWIAQMHERFATCAIAIGSKPGSLMIS